jgi:hypothetical protein
MFILCLVTFYEGLIPEIVDDFDTIIENRWAQSVIDH